MNEHKSIKYALQVTIEVFFFFCLQCVFSFVLLLQCYFHALALVLFATLVPQCPATAVATTVAEHRCPRWRFDAQRLPLAMAPGRSSQGRRHGDLGARTVSPPLDAGGAAPPLEGRRCGSDG